ncbi:MAG: FtsX-like permease family protein [Oligoflexia bacterium]|nr:FtsX-like permease family protein [Oligoflexia bacterium]
MKTRRGQFFNLVSILSIIGMALGIGTLVVVLSVISGFESAIKNAVVDVTGHILLLKRGAPLDPLSELEPRLQKLVPQITSTTPFVHVEGMVAHKGKLGGVVVEGFEPNDVEKTLTLRPRLVKGDFNLGTGLEKFPPVIIGQALAEKFELQIGDEVSVVLPKNNSTMKVLGFSARLKKFKVAGIMDMGMHQYDTRFMLTSAKAAQDLGGLGPVYTGLRIKLTDADLARDASFLISTELGLMYLTRDWVESNHNLFAAIKLERIVIFIVMLFMTVAACFNIASTLFISVLRRYGDISVFKTMGATQARLVRFFSLQGMVLGALGSILGIALGLSVCLVIAKTNFIYVPAAVYHLNRLPVEVRMIDIIMILASSFLLCFLSTLAPAIKGAKLHPVEGLKYDS